MTPYAIIQTVREFTSPESMFPDIPFKEKEVVMMCRYFIRQFCGWLPLRAIAEMTGAKDHTTVLWSIRKIEHESKFVYIRGRINGILNHQLVTNYKKAMTTENTTTTAMGQPTNRPHQWLPKIDSNPEHLALTKEQLYDQIGACNLKICKIEHDIPELEDMVSSPMMADDAGMSIGIRESLRENRQELAKLNDKVKSCRRTIIGRLEMELEANERAIATAHPNWNEGEAMRHMITEELETLRKLVD